MRDAIVWLGWDGWVGDVGGCHSHYVQADVKSASKAAVSLVEANYASASFETESLAAGAVYHYRFKILGMGDEGVVDGCGFPGHRQADLGG